MADPQKIPRRTVITPVPSHTPHVSFPVVAHARRTTPPEPPLAVSHVTPPGGVIGAPPVGVRHVPPSFAEIMGATGTGLGPDSGSPVQGVLEHLIGSSTPRTVQAQDPIGIQAWEQGNGPPPMLLGTTEPVPGGELGLSQKSYDILSKYARHEGLSLLEGDRLARALDQGFHVNPQSLDIGQYRYHQADREHVPSMLAHGFSLDPRSGAGRTDYQKPIGAYTKLDASFIPKVHPDEQASQFQIPLLHRTPEGRTASFDDAHDLVTMMYQADPAYRQLYDEYRDKVWPLRKQSMADREALLREAYDPALSPEARKAAHDKHRVLTDETDALTLPHIAMMRKRIGDVLGQHDIDTVRLLEDKGGISDEHQRAIETHIFLKPEQLRTPWAAFNPRRLQERGLLLSILGGLGLAGAQDQDQVGTPPPAPGGR